MYQSWPWGVTAATTASSDTATYLQSAAAAAQVATAQWPAGYNQYAVTPEMQQQWAAAWASQAQLAYGSTVAAVGQVPAAAYGGAWPEGYAQTGVSIGTEKGLDKKAAEKLKEKSTEELIPKDSAEIEKFNQLKAQAEQWKSLRQPSTPAWNQQDQAVVSQAISMLNANIPKVSISETKEEEEFERQFNDWEKQFETWKQQNINHPDKEAFARYEKQWQEWRSQLLQKKEQMQKAKAERLAGKAQENVQENAPDAKSFYQNSAYMYMQPYMYQQTGGQFSGQTAEAAYGDDPSKMPLLPLPGRDSNMNPESQDYEGSREKRYKYNQMQPGNEEDSMYQNFEGNQQDAFMSRIENEQDNWQYNNRGGGAGRGRASNRARGRGGRHGRGGRGGKWMTSPEADMDLPQQEVRGGQGPGFPPNMLPDEFADRSPYDSYPQDEFGQNFIPDEGDHFSGNRRGRPREGFPGDRQGAGGFPGDRPGLGGYPGDRQGLGGYPDDRPGGFRGDRQRAGGFPGDRAGTGSFPDDRSAPGGFPGDRVGGFPNDRPGRENFPGDRMGTGRDGYLERAGPGRGGFPDDRLGPGRDGYPGERPGRDRFPGDRLGPGREGFPEDRLGPGHDGFPSDRMGPRRDGFPSDRMGRDGYLGDRPIPGRDGFASDRPGPGHEGFLTDRPGRDGFPADRPGPGRTRLPVDRAVPGNDGFPGDRLGPGREGFPGDRPLPMRDEFSNEIPGRKGFPDDRPGHEEFPDDRPGHGEFPDDIPKQKDFPGDGPRPREDLPDEKSKPKGPVAEEFPIDKSKRPAEDNVSKPDTLPKDKIPGSGFSADGPPKPGFPGDGPPKSGFPGDGPPGPGFPGDGPPGPDHDGFPPEEPPFDFPLGEGPPGPDFPPDEFDERFPPHPQDRFPMRDPKRFPPLRDSERFIGPGGEFDDFPPMHDDRFGAPPFPEDFPPFVDDGMMPPPGRGGRFMGPGRGDFQPEEFDDRFPPERMRRGGMRGRGGPPFRPPRDFPPHDDGFRFGGGFPPDRRMPPGKNMRPPFDDPGFGPPRPGFPDDPYFDDGLSPPMQFKTIDYTHRPASSVLGDEFQANYDYESQFDSDVNNFRVIDYAHRRERSPPHPDREYGHQDPWSRGEGAMFRDDPWEPPFVDDQRGPPFRDGPRGPPFRGGPREPPFRDDPREPPFRDGPRELPFRDVPRDPLFRDGPRDPLFRDSPRDLPFRDGPREPPFRDGPREPAFRDSPSFRDSPRDAFGDSPRDREPPFRDDRREPPFREREHDRNRDRNRERDFGRDLSRDREGKENRDREKEKDRDREGKRDRDWEKDRKGKDEFDREKRFKWDRSEDKNSDKDRREDFYSKKENGERSNSESLDNKKNSDAFKSESTTEATLIKDLLIPPARLNRPKQLVIILRGLPGSGKTYIAKLIKDKEIENGGSAPRILSLDDYFMVETETNDVDPDTGKKVKKKEFQYEYELEMEEAYRTSLFKSFKKTIDDRFFPFIIIDAVHDKSKQYDQYWSYAKQRGFQVYIAELDCTDPVLCHKRNIHNRTLEDINKLLKNWERKPRHFLSLDVRSLLQDVAITEVEMEVESSEKKVEEKKEDLPEDDADEENTFMSHEPSRWEKLEATEEKLDQLDGLRITKKKHSSMEDYLQLPDDYEERKCEPGKKRVRWADLEERKDQDRLRAIGFVVGQTDWSKLTDPSSADRALTKTKYF